MTSEEYRRVRRLDESEGQKYGVRVNNPLTLPVRVELLSGKKVVGRAIVPPGSTVFMPVEPGDYSVRCTIIRLDGKNEVELGRGDWTKARHEDVEGARGPEEQKPSVEVEIRPLGEMFKELEKKEVA